jgi:hypothetical protein
LWAVRIVFRFAFGVVLSMDSPPWTVSKPVVIQIQRRKMTCDWMQVEGSMILIPVQIYGNTDDVDVRLNVKIMIFHRE